MSTKTTDAPVDTHSSGASRARPTWPLHLLAIVVAGLVGGTIAYSFLSESLAALGIPDPGAVTTYGLPFFRAVAWMLAALSIGSFMFSAFYISPSVPDGDNTRLNSATLTVDGHLAARTGAVSALLFGLIGLLMIPLVLSDTSGTPLSGVLNPSAIAVALEQVATSQAWLISALIAGVVGAVGLALRTWPSQPVLLLGAIGMIVPLGMEGHAASGGSHDYGTNAYLWHLVFMAVWIGGLMALIAHARRLGPDLETAVRRYSAVAFFAIAAVAVSGVVSMIIRIELSDLFTTRYGLIIVAKIAGTLILGLVGLAHRWLTIPQLKSDPRAFTRLAIGEVVIMAAVAGIAITMGRTPPPPPRDPNLSAMQIQMGYNLYEAPTFFNVWTIWRFDVMFGTIALLLAAGYLWGLWRVKKAGKDWPVSRTVWWLLGCASLALIMSSGIGMHIPASYSMHMVGHMLLSMVVPLFLAMGGPLGLIMTAWDSGEPGKPNVHDWAYAFTRTRFLRLLTIPWVNLLQFLIVFYVLYLFIPLYDLAISEHAGHLIMNFLFLISGYFYFWELVGPDPIPGRAPTTIRLVWLVVSMPIHLILGVYLMQLNVIMGEEFYRSLELPWDPDLLADQKSGGGIAWAFGSFPLTFVFMLMLVWWRREERVVEAKIDADFDEAALKRERRAAAKASAAATSGTDERPGPSTSTAAGAQAQAAEDEEEELDEFEAYNRMLQRYNEGEGGSISDYYNRGFPDQK